MTKACAKAAGRCKELSLSSLRGEGSGEGTLSAHPSILQDANGVAIIPAQGCEERAFHELKCVGGEFMVAIVFVGF